MTNYGKSSWMYETFIFDTRENPEADGELFIAPFGLHCSKEQKKAFSYLRAITLMMQLEGKPLFDREDLIAAIAAINQRWGNRLAASMSVHSVKAFDPTEHGDKDYVENYNQQLICLNPQLSLPTWGMEIQVAYMPVEAYADEDPENPTFLSAKEIDDFLAICHAKVGTEYDINEFQEFVQKSAEYQKETNTVNPEKESTIRSRIWSGQEALKSAAVASAARRALEQP